GGFWRTLHPLWLEAEAGAEQPRRNLASRRERGRSEYLHAAYQSPRTARAEPEDRGLNNDFDRHGGIAEKIANTYFENLLSDRRAALCEARLSGHQAQGGCAGRSGDLAQFSVARARTGHAGLSRQCAIVRELVSRLQAMGLFV